MEVHDLPKDEQHEFLIDSMVMMKTLIVGLKHGNDEEREIALDVSIANIRKVLETRNPAAMAAFVETLLKVTTDTFATRTGMHKAAIERLMDQRAKEMAKGDDLVIRHYDKIHEDEE